MAKRTEAQKAADRRYDEKRKAQRTRSWACIIYPESAPEGWIDALREAHIDTLISPLHDSDVTADGEFKKPHYHVLAMFPNPVTVDQAKNYFALAGYTASPEAVKNTKGYARYLVHMDDHDKHRYNECDVIALCGAAWAAAALDEGEQIDLTLTEIEDWIDDVHCYSYHALCRYARAERPDWTHVIRTHTIHLKQFLTSLMWEDHQKN